MEREADEWARLMAQAGALRDHELKRHASVSLKNNHQCVACFTCACAEEARLRRNGRRR